MLLHFALVLHFALILHFAAITFCGVTVVSNTYYKNKRQFKISEENVIRSIPAYDIVIGKRNDKALRLFYRQKPTKESVKGEPPCVLCITVQSQNFLHTANSSHYILVTFQLIQRCGQFG